MGAWKKRYYQAHAITGTRRRTSTPFRLRNGDAPRAHSRSAATQ